MAAGERSETISGSDNGLVFACLLDGKGGARRIGWTELNGDAPPDAPLWIHFDRGAEGAISWLSEDAGLSETTAKALLEEETRPRVFSSGDGLIAILRGINLNTGAEPDDMLALRACVTRDRLITVRYRPMMTPRDMLSELIDKRIGPATIPSLFVRLTERLTERMNSEVVQLDEALDEVEAQLDTGDTSELRGKLSNTRQAAVSLRRYIGPQREALARIHIEQPAWLDRELAIQLRESADKLQRYVEDLDAARDRAMVIRDELSNRLAEAMNQRMYVLSMIAGIFLPLGFITGLLGVNVGGMPGVENSLGFWLTCAGLVLLLALEVYLFRRLRWI
ncbi:zinc transporter ZntB [Methyloligella sp. 2.7D]|uniref:zinc transporter ZntB n=1 Tax=unclassified Methyloligella TaxID=2625955 RepID=UPI00157D8A29|nr:zinc transporter ZntB [Methyloligella sp. GL2]QKP77281.1 zinc transporter ZntB [Methyloligella sp. GL2]